MRLILSIIYLKLVLCNSIQAACVNPGMGTCDDGDPAQWASHDDGNNILKENTDCTGKTCSCGETNGNGPCDPCGRMTKYRADFCFDDVGCSNPCSVVPELPETFRFSFMLLFFSAAVMCIIYQNKKTPEIKS